MSEIETMLHYPLIFIAGCLHGLLIMAWLQDPRQKMKRKRKNDQTETSHEA